MEHKLFEWLSGYGPAALFFAQLFGIFGVPIPDELLLTISGALVRRGQMHGPSTVIAAIAGCGCGISFSYVLGRTVGLAAVHRLLRLHPAVLVRAQRWYQRFGVWVLAFGYFVPGVRHVSAIAAGSALLSYRRFAGAAYPGAVVWCATFLSIGYLAGDRWELVLATLRRRLPVLAVVALAAIAAYAFVATRRRRA